MHTVAKIRLKRDSLRSEVSLGSGSRRPHLHITVTERGHARCCQVLEVNVLSQGNHSRVTYVSAYTSLTLAPTSQSRRGTAIPVTHPQNSGHILFFSGHTINGGGVSSSRSRLQHRWASVGMLAAARFHSTFALLWSHKLPEALPHIGCGNMSEPRRRTSDEPNL